MTNVSLTDFQGHLRPAQVGDLCVLLEPTQDAQNRAHEWQRALQARFGGNLIERLHLTCQRFECADARQVEACVSGLRAIVARTKTFSLHAVTLETLYVPVRETNILKWRVEISEALCQLLAEVRDVLIRQGIEPHYASDFVPTLVTALKDVPEVSQAELENGARCPDPLFESGQLVISRILGPNDFLIEGIAAW